MTTALLRQRTLQSIRHGHNLFDKFPTSIQPRWDSGSISDYPLLSLLSSTSNPHTDLKALHAYSITSGLLLSPFAASRVVVFFLRSRHHAALHHAVSVFHSVPRPDVYTWNAMIAAFATHCSLEYAIEFYFHMRAHQAPPNAYSFALLVKACMFAGIAGVGKKVHGQVLKCGVEGLLVVKNSLLSMYCNMGMLEDARVLFDESLVLDLISWNTMISAFGKNGDVEAAWELFDRMPDRNLVSWSAMIDGCVRCGDSSEALRLFGGMQEERIKPDGVVLASVLKACAHLGALSHGRWIHAYVDRNELGRDGNVVLWTAVIDMYSKCGCVDAALEVFGELRFVGDVVLWNAMIGGLAMNGYGVAALDVFQQMEKLRVKPNKTTFIGVLCACAHSGLVDEGKMIFESMKEHGVEPEREHYGSLADILARSGKLQEAEKILLNMPMEPHASQWGALMSACRTYNNIDVGERVGKRLIALEPHDGSRYVLLANTYATAGRWQDAGDTRKSLEAEGVAKKEIGCSFLECNGIVHEFLVGDMTHPQSRDIYTKLGEMERKLAVAGYVKDTSQLLFDMDVEEEKETALSYHSEKLAIAFGIMNIDPGIPIRIVKNLRVCRDCHAYTKLVSKVYQRELIVRDRNRFHRFIDGACSCKDYW